MSFWCEPCATSDPCKCKHVVKRKFEQLSHEELEFIWDWMFKDIGCLSIMWAKLRGEIKEELELRG